MNKNDFLKHCGSFFDTCLDTLQAKNSDYTNTSDNPFANFESVKSLGISAETGILTRMMDKMSRLASFSAGKSLQVKDESVHDTLMDLACYSAIFSAMIKSKNEEKTLRMDGAL